MSRGCAGQLVYAVGDIHGRYDLLRDLLARIAGDIVARGAGRRPILVLLGDYVDRGPESPKVLEALTWLRRRADLEVHLLKGNHEQALLEFLEAPERGAGWLRYGGLETLVSYGVAPPDPEAGEPGMARARDDLLTVMPAAHLRLLQGLELMVEVGDYAFVHAGVRPGAALADQTEHDLLWIRQEFLESPGPFEKTIVHGHTWLDHRPQLTDGRLGLDTGAYVTGVLTACRLEDGVREVMQAGTLSEAAARPAA